MGENKLKKKWLSTILRYWWLPVALASVIYTLDLSHKLKQNILYGDAEGYYLYLPAIFIHGTFVQLPVRADNQMMLYEDTEKRYTKYTCGVAMLEAPFSLVAHAIASARQETDYKGFEGYSKHYLKAISLAATVYVLIGLWLLQVALQRYVPKAAAVLTVLTLYFGTNLFYYSIEEPGMSHAYSFFLFSWFVYLVPSYYERPAIWRNLLLGSIAGLIVLIRPTNLLLLLYLFFFETRNLEDLSKRLHFFREHFWKSLFFPLAALVPFIPQICYWYYISGDLILYSYQNEGFIYWQNPKIWNVFFHIKGGWLLFTPLGLLLLASMIWAAVRNAVQGRVILLIFLLAVYAFGSWWCWWFGGAFGYRSMVEFYVLMAFPFGYALHRIYTSRNFFLLILTSLLLSLCVYFNLGMGHFFRGPHISWERWQELVQGLFWSGLG